MKNRRPPGMGYRAPDWFWEKPKIGFWWKLWFLFCLVVCIAVMALGIWGVIYFGGHLVDYLDRH